MNQPDDIRAGSTLSAGLASDSLTELLARLDGFHAEQLRVCEGLERLADGLPENIDRQAALHIARLLGPLVRSAHSFEEGAVFPALRSVCGDVPRLADSLERLQYEHWGDEAFADELCEEIIAYVADATGSADKLAYMLRGFFEGVRRHIAFEREHLMPMISGASRRLH